MNLQRTAARILAGAVLGVLAAACNRDDTQVLTDTSAAGSSGGGSAASEQLEATPGRIERAFAADTALRGLELEAEEEDNRVVIKGTVRNDAQMTRALQIATREAGGIQVQNQIRVDARR